jgi:hypothetical protein
MTTAVAYCSTTAAAEKELANIRGFYPTPASVIDMMLERIGSRMPSGRVLEPSAGRGDIADRLRGGGGELVVVEPHPVLARLLRDKGYAPVVCRFEDYESAEPFDGIVMNPPFADGLDMLHARHAFAMLAAGGVLVALMNDGDAPGDGTPAQRDDFAAWLMRDRAIDSFSIERVNPRLLRSAANFRPSRIPVKLLTMRRRSGHGMG